jgi:nicotinate-nucleotide--dimethylbenzimidazole phosphoribosyltransferase
MTPAECDAAVAAGTDLAMERFRAGAEVLALGDMGIGNTTSASALTAAILGLPADRLVGPGTGSTGARLQAKRTAVRLGLERVSGVAEPLRLLRELGGFEIAGMVGAILAAAGASRTVVVDGFVVTAAALVAARLAPAVVDYMVAAHRSAEPGHVIQLEALGLVPLLDLSLRLGEGTGALLALPLLTAAAGLLRDMATFESAGIAGPAGAPT